MRDTTDKTTEIQPVCQELRNLAIKLLERRLSHDRETCQEILVTFSRVPNLGKHTVETVEGVNLSSRGCF